MADHHHRGQPLQLVHLARHFVHPALSRPKTVSTTSGNIYNNSDYASVLFMA